jgi:hypothetical protein
MAKNRKKGKQAELEAKVENNSPALRESKPQTQKAQPKKTKAERRQDHIDGIKKTVYPAAIGVLAGFACYYLLGPGTSLPWHFILIVALSAAYIIQKLTFPFLGIASAEFKAKDWIYVEFVVLDLLLVTWTILLN